MGYQGNINISMLVAEAVKQDILTSFWAEQAYAFISTTIGYCALIGNGYVLAVMLSALARRGVKPIDLLYLQLVLSDLLISLNLLYAGSVLNRGRFMFTIFGLNTYNEAGLCIFMGSLGKVASTFALSSVTGLMICVLLAVQCPVQYQQRISLGSVLLYMGLTGCYNAVIVLFPFLVGYRVPYNALNGECMMSLDVWFEVEHITGTGRFFISLFLEWLPTLALVVIVTVCGALTFVGLAGRGAGRYREVAINMLLISMAYFIFNIPSNIVIIIDMIDKSFWGDKSITLLFNFVVIMQLTSRATVLTNPIIFHFRRKQFVDDAKTMVMKNEAVELECARVNVVNQTENSTLTVNYDTFTHSSVGE